MFVRTSSCVHVLSLVAFLAVGCSDAAPAAEQAPPSSATGLRSQGEGPLVVFLGDSLTAGLGLARSEAYPALVHDRLEADGVELRIINAGVSGDTTAGGRARLDWLLSQQPDLVFVSLGANDGLRTREISEIRADLEAILSGIQDHGARAILAGQMLPPNYGPAYTDAFRDLYPALAAELDVALLPFLLEGVAAVPELNMPDGLHPNADGHELIADLVLPLVRDELALLPR